MAIQRRIDHEAVAGGRQAQEPIRAALIVCDRIERDGWVDALPRFGVDHCIGGLLAQDAHRAAEDAAQRQRHVDIEPLFKALHAHDGCRRRRCDAAIVLCLMDAGARVDEAQGVAAGRQAAHFVAARRTGRRRADKAGGRLRPRLEPDFDIGQRGVASAAYQPADGGAVAFHAGIQVDAGGSDGAGHRHRLRIVG